ncbi:hypothetical protein [Planobispora rosea]|uniref:hypothetical protein n=1 Tax=Planobispora rosea TaxID=35762 RepID=UPI00083A2F19|nr:hypothetical protein [Planobispora rosea]
MDEPPPRARPPAAPGWAGRAGWPASPAEEDLPPSARWYGTPAAPSRHRIPRGLRRPLLGLLALAVCAGAVAGAVLLVVRVVSAPPPPARVADPAAGVGYPLPAGWRQGALPPVTGFTSAAGNGRDVTVMVRPGEPAADPREAVTGLADLYSRLLLHGDEVEVEDDRAVAAGGWTGHSRTLRAEYRDVVNRPAYLRVVLLTGPGGDPVVVVAVAESDDPRVRGEIDQVIAGIRRE